MEKKAADCSLPQTHRNKELEPGEDERHSDALQNTQLCLETQLTAKTDEFRQISIKLSVLSHVRPPDSGPERMEGGPSRVTLGGQRGPEKRRREDPHKMSNHCGVGDKRDSLPWEQEVPGKQQMRGEAESEAEMFLFPTNHQLSFY